MTNALVIVDAQGDCDIVFVPKGERKHVDMGGSSASARVKMAEAGARHC